MDALSPRLRIIAATAVAAIALTACGGGAGAPGLPPKTTPPSTPQSSQQQQQQAAAATAMQQVHVQQWERKYVGSAQAPTRFRQALHAQYLHTMHAMDASPSPSASPSPAPSASPSACAGNSQETVTQNSDGSITINETGYYDACTTLMYQSTNLISAPDPSGKMTTKGQETDYAQDGKTVNEYDVIAGVIYNANYGSGDMSMSIARYANATAAGAANAAPFDTDYFAYVDTAPNSQNVGAASIMQDPAFPGGELGSVSTYNTTYTGGLFQTNTAVNVTGSTTNLIDHAGRLTIAQNPLAAGQYAWTINGGSTLSTTTETQKSSVDDTGYLLAYTDTIVDSADDLTTTITGNVGGTQYKGVLTQTSSGITLATFVVDANGDGTITFANGTTLPVVNWCWN